MVVCMLSETGRRGALDWVTLSLRCCQSGYLHLVRLVFVLEYAFVGAHAILMVFLLLLLV